MSNKYSQNKSIAHSDSSSSSISANDNECHLDQNQTAAVVSAIQNADINVDAIGPTHAPPSIFNTNDAYRNNHLCTYAHAYASAYDDNNNHNIFNNEQDCTNAIEGPLLLHKSQFQCQPQLQPQPYMYFTEQQGHDQGKQNNDHPQIQQQKEQSNKQSCKTAMCLASFAHTEMSANNGNSSPVSMAPSTNTVTSAELYMAPTSNNNILKQPADNYYFSSSNNKKKDHQDGTEPLTSHSHSQSYPIDYSTLALASPYRYNEKIQSQAYAYDIDMDLSLQRNTQQQQQSHNEISVPYARVQNSNTGNYEYPVPVNSATGIQMMSRNHKSHIYPQNNNYATSFAGQKMSSSTCTGAEAGIISSDYSQCFDEYIPGSNDKDQVPEPLKTPYVRSYSDSQEVLCDVNASIMEPIPIQNCLVKHPFYFSRPIRNRSDAAKMPRFPHLLYQLLMDSEMSSFSDCISWLPHGRAFIIQNTSKFEAFVMNKYFTNSNWKSFRRQLNLYEFVRICQGKDRGGYYHPSLLRGRPDVLNNIKCVRVKGEKSKHSKKSGDKYTEVIDLYSFGPISPPPVDESVRMDCFRK